jgi:hypothetical protein
VSNHLYFEYRIIGKNTVLGMMILMSAAARV